MNGTTDLDDFELLFLRHHFFDHCAALRRLRVHREKLRPVFPRMKVQVVAFHDRFGVAGLQSGVTDGTVQGDVVTDEAVAHFIVLELMVLADLGDPPFEVRGQDRFTVGL